MDNPFRKTVGRGHILLLRRSESFWNMIRRMATTLPCAPNSPAALPLVKLRRKPAQTSGKPSNSICRPAKSNCLKYEGGRGDGWVIAARRGSLQTRRSEFVAQHNGRVLPFGAMRAIIEGSGIAPAEWLKQAARVPSSSAPGKCIEMISHRAGDIAKTGLPQNGVVEETLDEYHVRVLPDLLPAIPPRPLTKAPRSLDFIGSTTSTAAGTPVRQGGEWSGAAQAFFR